MGGQAERTETDEIKTTGAKPGPSGSGGPGPWDDVWAVGGAGRRRNIVDIDKLIEAIRLCGSQPNVRQCRNYAYYAGGDMSRCIPRMTADASAALSALRAELEQVKRERDAAYKLLGGEPPKTCKTCVLWGGNGWGQYQIGYCDGDDNPHGPNDFCSRHRGPQKEG